MSNRSLYSCSHSFEIKNIKEQIRILTDLIIDLQQKVEKIEHKNKKKNSFSYLYLTLPLSSYFFYKYFSSNR
jgi:hypothetical protein